jgi:hypothetical protein
MGGESGKLSEERRRHSWRAMSRRRERAPRSQPPDGAKADGIGLGIGSKQRTACGMPAGGSCCLRALRIDDP